MAHRTYNTSDLVPSTAPAPGQLLWGDAPARQPIAPLILMAVVLLLVAAPTALGGGGGSANPIQLMRQIADSTYALAGLMGGANASLASIDENSRHLFDLQTNMIEIAASTSGMEAQTVELNKTLGTVGSALTSSRARLASVDGKLGETAGGMGALRTNVSGSATSTKKIVSEFKLIDRAIGSMDRSLEGAITKMAASGPLTTEFANNATRLEVAGGDSTKYGVPNLAPNSRVMSVVLPMIAVMQKGGPLPARKDRHEASNFVVGTALKMKVPDGVNVVAMVKPFSYDNFYGLPDENFFVQHRIHGF